MVEDDSPDTPSPNTGSSDIGSPDIQSTKTAVTTEREPDPYRREILLALIQHGSRPLGLLLIALAVLFAVYCARYQIQVLLANAESLKVGTLELRLREVAAQSPEIGKQIRSLGDLTDEQLQLFLIICAQREKDINYIGPQVTLPNLRKLEALGLLEGVTWEPPEPFHWHVTAQGSALHKIVMGIVTDSVSRALQCPICSKGAEQPNK